MTRFALLAFVLVLAACPAHKPPPGPAVVPDEIAEIVRLEGARSGNDRLLELAVSKNPMVRQRAILALGRQGDPDNVGLIASFLVDAPVREQAAEALGLIGDPAAAPALITVLTAALDENDESPWLATVASAIGRTGDELDAPAALQRLLDAKTPSLRAAGALALGGLGLRKVGCGGDALERLTELASDADPEVRYAVAYALMRTVMPAGAPWQVRDALQKLAADDQAETRALAVRALGAQQAVDVKAVSAALLDGDWRVRVQAIRALTAPGTTAPQHGLVAMWLVDEIDRAQDHPNRWDGAVAHPMLEALERLQPFAGEDEVARAYTGAVPTLAHMLEGGARGSRLAVSTGHCLAVAGAARTGGDVSAILMCGGARADAGAAAGYPDHLKKTLLLSTLGLQVMPTSAALGLIGPLAADGDPRVRAAAAESAAGYLPNDEAMDLMIAALEDRDLYVAATAAEALAGQIKPPMDPLLAPLVGRVAARMGEAGAEPEVQQSLLAPICAARSRVYTGVLNGALTSPSRAVREKARGCLKELTGEDPGPGNASGEPASTPADPTALLGQRVAWTVKTSRGEFTLELDPELAPWNVATMTALAQKGYYDGTLWHRVVADFVVQGGDPTGSGWGGPGYSVPAEASMHPYVRGAIGVADSGKDTGGSQWFIMHSRAPHLEQRYTLVGQVVSGMDVVDTLLVGDTILSVQVTVEPVVE